MRNTALEYRYAKALLEAAHTAGILDAVQADMAMLQQVFDEASDIVSLITGDDDKKIRQFISGPLAQQCSQLTRQFLDVLDSNRRFKVLPYIPAAFLRLYRELSDTLTVDIISAVPLEQETVGALVERIRLRTGKQCVARESIDTKLLAGFIVMYGDVRIDCSTAGKLKRAKEYLKMVAV